MVNAKDKPEKQQTDATAELRGQGYTKTQAKKKAAELFPTQRQQNARNARTAKRTK